MHALLSPSCADGVRLGQLQLEGAGEARHQRRESPRHIVTVVWCDMKKYSGVHPRGVYTNTTKFSKKKTVKGVEN